jgi:hypothetical protein
LGSNTPMGSQSFKRSRSSRCVRRTQEASCSTRKGYRAVLMELAVWTAEGASYRRDPASSSYSPNS